MSKPRLGGNIDVSNSLTFAYRNTVLDKQTEGEFLHIRFGKGIDPSPSIKFLMVCGILGCCWFFISQFVMNKLAKSSVKIIKIPHKTRIGLRDGGIKIILGPWETKVNLMGSEFKALTRKGKSGDPTV